MQHTSVSGKGDTGHALDAMAGGHGAVAGNPSAAMMRPCGSTQDPSFAMAGKLRGQPIYGGAL
jgi:hypothetical protein